MEFSVLNKQAIQCVMTQKEVADYGLDKKALFKNDERVQEFFRSIMQRAERETGVSKIKGNIMVRASFLADEKLKITFLFEKTDAWPQQVKTAILKSRDLMHLAAFSRHAPKGLKTWLYKYRGVFFLLADIRAYSLYETAVFYTLADEYVDAVCHTEGIAAFLKEHGVCMVSKNAIDVLGDL